MLAYADVPAIPEYTPMDDLDCLQRANLTAS
jgi:hypothetical protein